MSQSPEVIEINIRVRINTGDGEVPLHVHLPFYDKDSEKIAYLFSMNACFITSNRTVLNAKDKM